MNNNPTPAQKQLLSVLDKTINDINAQIEDKIAQLPEGVFVNYFLPIFCGEVPADTPQSIELINTWYGIAGNPYRPVDVINEKKEVIFQVPALMNNKAVDPVRGSRTGLSFKQILAGSQQLGQVSPEMSKNYLEKNLINRDLLNVDTPEFREASQKWTEIFKRYGKPLEPTSNGAAAQTSSDQGSEPDLVYE